MNGNLINERKKTVKWTESSVISKNEQLLIEPVHYVNFTNR